MTPGQTCYEAYGAALCWMKDGSPMTVWQRLPDWDREAWEAVGRAGKAAAAAAMLRKPSDSQRSNR
jgi:hypothetical protein